jgi:hypothetical protein
MYVRSEEVGKDISNEWRLYCKGFKAEVLLSQERDQRREPALYKILHVNRPAILSAYYTRGVDNFIVKEKSQVICRSTELKC